MVREEESSTKYVAESDRGLKKTVSTVTKITEYLWTFEVQFVVALQTGSGSGGSATTTRELQRHRASTQIMTLAETSPRAARRVCDTIGVNVSWWATRSCGDNGAVDEAALFNIERGKKTCYTPSNNEEIAAALQCMSDVRQFAALVNGYLRGLFALQATRVQSSLDASVMDGERVVVPVLPLLMSSDATAASVYVTTAAEFGENVEAATFPANEQRKVLAHHRKQLDARRDAIAQHLPKDRDLMTSVSGLVVFVCQHVELIVARHQSAVAYVEHLLETQLIASVGKVLTAVRGAREGAGGG